jgi:hypothetical protein
MSLTVFSVSIARKIRSPFNTRETLTQIVVSFREILVDRVDVKPSDAAFEIFLLADNFFVESRRILWQTADEKHVGDEEFLRNFHLRLTNSDTRILSVAMNAQGCNVISAVNRNVMPQTVVHLHRQRNLFSLSTSYDKSNVTVA